jgi:hypothetical protein
MKLCWPGKAAPEIVSHMGWQVLRLMSHAQWTELRARLAAEVERLDWRACRSIAEDLKLSYSQARVPSGRPREMKRSEGFSISRDCS